MAKLPEHALTVRTYAEFQGDVKKLAEGRYNFLLIIGNSGLSKTRTVEDTLGDACAIISGTPTSWRFYQWAYDNLDKTLVLDDVAGKFFRSDVTNSLLKALTDTRAEKTIQWPTTSAGEEKEYQSKFTTRSRVIILVNDWDSADEHVRAIEGRATTLIFQPSFTEVHSAVAEWFTDQEVFDYVYEHRRFCVKPNMRLYVKALEQKQAGSPWRKRTLEMLIGDERMQQIATLLADERYTSNQQRCKAFERAGYGGSTTFYKLLAEFKNLVPDDDSGAIRLKNPQ